MPGPHGPLARSCDLSSAELRTCGGPQVCRTVSRMPQDRSSAGMQRGLWQTRGRTELHGAVGLHGAVDHGSVGLRTCGPRTCGPRSCEPLADLWGCGAVGLRTCRCGPVACGPVACGPVAYGPVGHGPTDLWKIRGCACVVRDDPWMRMRRPWREDPWVRTHPITRNAN